MDCEEDEPKRIRPEKRAPISTIPTLPPELITEILSRLPVKSLLKFMCVSKPWLALISSPEFIKTHLSLSINSKENTRQMIIMSSIGDKHKICSIRSLLYESVMEASDLYFPIRKTSLRIVGSVNGLICFGIGYFVIWNPSIRKFKKVVATKDHGCPYSVYGFGYDELRDDYKIVTVNYCANKDVKVIIYSLKNESWRRLDDSPGGPLGHHPGVLVNGKLHWNSCGGSSIISIDLAEEKWGKLEKPFEEESLYQLGVLGSDLCMFDNYDGDCTNVWVMKEYGIKESWAKIYTFRFPDDTPNVWYPLLCKSNKGEVLIVFLARFMIYYPKDDSIRNVATSCPYCNADFYIESLVCPFPIEPRTQQ